MTMQQDIVQRFVRYAMIDTQSDPSSSTVPSTAKQKDLAKLLVEELQILGLQSVEMDSNGYVYAKLPSNVAHEVPCICFCSHMDTSPDCSGKGVRPIIHKGYDGRDLILPDDETQIIRLSDHPGLLEQMGEDIITASGTTLLGADNKAGISEIMDAMQFLVNHPEIEHGEISILFTPDEEIGRGVDHVNLEKVGAKFAYTIDGESRGHVEDETFSADEFIVEILGVSSHPGFAKGKMESALKIAAEIVAALPKELAPEFTSEQQGFLHPLAIKGDIEKAHINFILRDFETERLQSHAEIIRKIAKEVLQNYPNSSIQFEQRVQYRNMKEVLNDCREVVDYAAQAIEAVGMKATVGGIRGGTDGSRLSFMGLPCPNIFAGEHAFHSKHEWVSVKDMQLASAVIVQLVQIWARSK